MTRALWLLEAASARHPDSEALRLGLAETAIAVGAPEQALTVLASVLADPATDLRVPLLRHRAQLALGDLEGALETLERAEPHHPGIELAVARITVLASEKRYDRALEVVRSRTDGPGLSEAERRWLLRSEADLLALGGDTQAALARLEPLTVDAAGAPDLEAWRSRVALLSGLGRTHDAIAELDAATQAHPDAAGFEGILANAYLAIGDAASAESLLRTRQEREPTPANTINLADFLHRTGRPGEAAELIARQLAVDPGARETELEYLVGALRLEAGDTDAAREALRGFVARHPADPHTDYLRARFALSDGHPEAAAVRLKQLLPRLDRADVHHWLAVALERSGDHEGAEQRYGVAVYADPTQIPSYHGLLRTLARRGAWGQVDEWARRLLQIAPDSTGAYEALVQARIARGDASGAEAVTQSYVERYPGLLAPRVATSIALRRQGRPEAALAALDAVASEFGREPDWIAERGIVLERLGRGTAGLAAVDDAIALHPDSTALRRARSYLLFTADRGDEGLREVEALRRLAPDDARPLQLAGDYYAMRGDFETARTLYQRFLRVEPGDAGVLFHLAIALTALGDEAEAIAVYRRAADAAPDAAPPRNNLALLLDRQGRRDEALIEAQAAYARADADPSVLDTLGWLYLKAGRAERAVGLLERADTLAPGAVEVRYHLALAYREVDRAAEARGLLEALQADTGPDHALRARIDEAWNASPAP